jgi:hypothetical protein
MRTIEKLFNNLVNNDEISALESFNSAIQDKLNQAMEIKKVAITADVFNESNYERAMKARMAISNTKTSIKAKQATLASYQQSPKASTPEYREKIAKVKDKLEDLKYILKNQESYLQRIQAQKK